jgi:hypothetical protein
MPETGGLGRRPPTDRRHEALYPLRAALPETVETVERVLTINYEYRPRYDQGSEGACVGFACSWAMSFLNRRFYDARWLYKTAQIIDEWDGENYSGTSVRAGMDVLRETGHRRIIGERTLPIQPTHGIQSNYWTSNVDGVRTAIAAGVPVVLGVDWMSAFDRPEQKYTNEWWIGRADLGRVRGGHAICCYGASDRREAVKLVNSWGLRYPPVWMPYTTLQRVLDGIQSPGDAAVIIDRPEPMFLS